LHDTAAATEHSVVKQNDERRADAAPLVKF
jgi:hypothetical protein